MPNLRPLITVFALALLCVNAASAQETGDGEAFIEYVRIHPMIAGNEGRTVMRWMTDGRVEIRIPPYAKNGGEYELAPGEYDIDTLESVIARTEKAQQALQNIDVKRSLARTGEIHQVHDGDIVQIKTHPFSRAPIDLQIESPDHWAQVLADNDALEEAAEIDRVLMDWIQSHAAIKSSAATHQLSTQ